MSQDLNKNLIKTAIVFPGQGSQKLGMLAEFSDFNLFPEVKLIYQEASDVLNYDLWALTQKDELKLNQTQYTQPAILAASCALFKIFSNPARALDLFSSSHICVMAGHSLGEYTALVCSGALKFSDAISLVSFRGQFMQEAVPEGVGAMAAILGLEDSKVLEACDLARESDVVNAVNFNSPGQVVIAGHESAVFRAMDFAKQLGAKRALPLPVSVPSHCELMAPAALRLAEILKNIDLNNLNNLIPVIHNVDVLSHQNNPAEIKQALVKQLADPVQWVKSIASMVKNYGVSRVIEIGPGKVLTGLNKRIISELGSELGSENLGVESLSFNGEELIIKN